jgi:hypothetical protein
MIQLKKLFHSTIEACSLGGQSVSNSPVVPAVSLGCFDWAGKYSSYFRKEASRSLFSRRKKTVLILVVSRLVCWTPYLFLTLRPICPNNSIDMQASMNIQVFTMKDSKFDASALGHKLDDFDEWFGAIHDKPSHDEPSHDKSSKKANCVSEALKIAETDDDDDSSSSSREKSSPSRKKTKKIKHGGTLDKLLSGKSIMNSSTRERLIQARGERTQRAKVERQNGVDQSRNRRRCVRASTDRFLGAVHEDAEVIQPRMPIKTRVDLLGSASLHGRRRSTARVELSSSQHSTRRPSTSRASSEDIKSSSQHSRRRASLSSSQHNRRSRSGTSDRDDLGPSQHNRILMRKDKDPSPAAPKIPSGHSREIREGHKRDKKASLKIPAFRSNEAAVIIPLEKETLADMLPRASIGEETLCTMAAERKSTTSRHSISKRRSHVAKVCHHHLPPKPPSPRKTTRSVALEATIDDDGWGGVFKVVCPGTPSVRRRPDTATGSPGSLAKARRRHALRMSQTSSQAILQVEPNI